MSACARMPVLFKLTSSDGGRIGHQELEMLEILHRAGPGHAIGVSVPYEFEITPIYPVPPEESEPGELLVGADRLEDVGLLKLAAWLREVAEVCEVTRGIEIHQLEEASHESR